MFSKELETVVANCYKEARERRYEFMTVEQMLKFLLQDNDLKTFINQCGQNSDRIISTLEEHITSSASLIPDDADRETKPDLAFQRVLQRAVYHVQSAGESEVKTLNCLVAIFGEKDSFGVLLLQTLGIERLDVVNYVTTGSISLPQPDGEQQIEKIKDSPRIIQPVHSLDTPKLRVFISYSHSDKCCLDRLLVHLRPLSKKGLVDTWSDRRIKAGDKWKEEISNNINQAAVAVLLVSADFLASNFIVDHELPPLLIAAESKGTRIIPVIVKPCGFTRDEVLSSFQCINDPKEPLLGLNDIGQEHLYDEIASAIHEEFRARSLKF